MDLAVVGRIDVASQHVVVIDPTATGHPLIDALLRRIQQDRRANSEMLPRTRYPVPNGVAPPAEARARERMRAAATGQDPVDASTAVLCGLVCAMGWARPAGSPPRQVDARFDEIRRPVWAAVVIKKAIDDARSASAEAAAG
jgi:hypothetical protein